MPYSVTFIILCEDNSIPFMPSNFSDKEEIDQYLDDVIDQIDPEELEELF